jgi:hypothetical protein
MMQRPGQFENRLSPLFKYLFGLDREPKGHFGFAVENLKDLVAEQATEFTLRPAYGKQLNPAVASLAFGTGDIGLFHSRGKLPSLATSSNRGHTATVS